MMTVDPLLVRSRSGQPAPQNPFREWPKREIEQTLHGRFERVVAACAERAAVITRAERVTYRTLNARANRVARAIVATLATLKAGKLYVPLEPQRTSAVSRLLDDVQAQLVVTDALGLPAARELCGTGIDVLDIDRIDSAVAD